MKNSFPSHNLLVTPLPKFSCFYCSSSSSASASSSSAAAAASSSSSASSSSTLQCQKCKRDIYCVQKKTGNRLQNPVHENTNPKRRQQWTTPAQSATTLQLWRFHIEVPENCCWKLRKQQQQLAKKKQHTN
jgi:hypothetical protein